jgi:hypothetical protein
MKKLKNYNICVLSVIIFSTEPPSTNSHQKYITNNKFERNESSSAKHHNEGTSEKFHNLTF